MFIHVEGLAEKPNLWGEWTIRSAPSSKTLTPNTKKLYFKKLQPTILGNGNNAYVKYITIYHVLSIRNPTYQLDVHMWRWIKPMLNIQ
jgi:hypothetical protein